MARSTLFSAQLYGIVDLGYAAPDDLVRVTREMIAGGIDVIQLRAKGHEPNDIERWARKLLPQSAPTEFTSARTMPRWTTSGLSWETRCWSEDRLTASIRQQKQRLIHKPTALDLVRFFPRQRSRLTHRSARRKSKLSMLGIPIFPFSALAGSKKRTFAMSSLQEPNAPLLYQESCKHPTSLLTSASPRKFYTRRRRPNTFHFLLSTSHFL